MAATGEKRGDFDLVTARYVNLKNETGDIVVFLGANRVGDGVVSTRSAEGKTLAMLNSAIDHKGTVQTCQPNGKLLVDLNADDNGDLINVYNRKGDDISRMYADKIGNWAVMAIDAR